MIPPVIEDYIRNLGDKSKHPERRQFYADTLRAVQKEVASALLSFDKERNIIVKTPLKRKESR
jgi:hypothetical protein